MYIHLSLLNTPVLVCFDLYLLPGFLYVFRDVYRAVMGVYIRLGLLQCALSVRMLKEETCNL